MRNPFRINTLGHNFKATETNASARGTHVYPYRIDILAVSKSLSLPRGHRPLRSPSFVLRSSPSFAVPVVGQKTSNDEMDGYVIRLRKDAHDIVYVTRMGGSAYDSASRVAVDAQGNAWVAGFTKSSDFAVTADAWQKTYGGDGDAFLVKLSPAGEVLFATFIGAPRVRLRQCNRHCQQSTHHWRYE